jgi:hypothetical protein
VLVELDLGVEDLLADRDRERAGAGDLLGKLGDGVLEGVLRDDQEPILTSWPSSTSTGPTT